MTRATEVLMWMVELKTNELWTKFENEPDAVFKVIDGLDRYLEELLGVGVANC